MDELMSSERTNLHLLRLHELLSSQRLVHRIFEPLQCQGQRVSIVGLRSRLKHRHRFGERRAALAVAAAALTHGCEHVGVHLEEHLQLGSCDVAVVDQLGLQWPAEAAGLGGVEDLPHVAINQSAEERVNLCDATVERLFRHASACETRRH